VELAALTHEESEFDAFEALVQEPPGGESHGRSARNGLPSEDGDDQSHDYLTHNGVDFRAGGFQTIGEGAFHEHGMIAHRGILSRWEHDNLDWDEVGAAVADELGSTLAEVDRLYNGRGPIASHLRDRKLELDEKLLQAVEAGSSASALAHALGWEVRKTPTGVECRKMTRALARARTRRSTVA
jgi:hypothetical protein